MNLRRHFAFALVSFLAVTVFAEEWQNHHILQVNREPARSYFIPYNQQPGDMSMSLNGTWEFRWAPTPEDIDKMEWGTFIVPANWEVNSTGKTYGTPIYSSAGYTYKIRPPYVMDEPKAGYTTVKERNPTGQYRRTVSIPEEWLNDGGRTYIRFDGVMSAFYLKVNGKDVGYSQGSNHPSEFDITNYLSATTHHPSPNTQIEILVHKYSDGSYLEDQDAWRFAGIHRDVTLFHTPALRLRDFTVRTIAADDTYRNFHLQINPQLEAAPGIDGKGYIVVATLYDAEGKQVVRMEHDAEEILNVSHKAGVMNEWYPQRGRMKFERMDTLLTDVNPWTAETPYLYDLKVEVQPHPSNPLPLEGRGSERASLNENADNAVVKENSKTHPSPSLLTGGGLGGGSVRVGFRQLAIKDGRFLVNGKQVRFRGVNRVEHDPYTAHAMSYERLLQDVKLMKAANINAIRTAHAPAHPRLYDICDSLGMYVLDEADCENHGVRGEFTSTPDWNQAMMDRVIRLAERDKNHPCVVFWSLGNESGYGANHSAMAGWLHEFDPTRFVHYEGAQGDPDPLCVDVISRFYPRVQEEYLNPGIPEGSDKERAENARWEFLLSIAQRKQYFKGGYLDGVLDTRPVLTSEYAHCMGNALGNFQEYWDEIYSNPRMLGGFVWDWVDQGIIKTLPSNPLPLIGRGRTNVSSAGNTSYLSPSLLTGGGSEGGSVLYGGDFGDKPNLKAFCLNGIVKCDRELTNKYYEVQHVYAPVQFCKHGNDVYVINRNHHIGLSAYKATGVLMVNGKKQKPFAIALPDVAPGDSAMLALPANMKCKAGAHNLLNITVERDGQKITDEQFALSGSVLDFNAPQHPSPITYHPSPNTHYLSSFFRAPTDNDKSFGNWVAKDWTKNRVDSPSVKRISSREEGATQITVDEYTFDNGIEQMGGKVIVTTRQTPVGKNAVDIVTEYECAGNLPELPRMGIMIELPKGYETMEYYGRGPLDTYPDRWRSCHVGLWQSTVTEQYAHFPVPQDCGNHGECSYMKLSGKGLHPVTVTAVRDSEADNDGVFSFSALHFTPQEIAAYRHDYELMEAQRQGKVGNHTVLSIDCAVMGIGNSSCGPGVLKKYSIDKTRKHKLHIILTSAK